MLVVADDRPGRRDGEVGEQAAQTTGVLGRDDVGGRELLRRARGARRAGRRSGWPRGRGCRCSCRHPRSAAPASRHRPPGDARPGSRRGVSRARPHRGLETRRETSTRYDWTMSDPGPRPRPSSSSRPTAASRTPRRSPPASRRRSSTPRSAPPCDSSARSSARRSTRHEGPELLALVERVRAPGPRARGRRAARRARRRRRADRRRPGPRLHRLLPARQRHRAAAPLAGAERRRRGAARRDRRAHRRGARGRAPSSATSSSEVLGRLEYRPVFTAHPTEATRRTVLNLLRRIAVTVDELEDPRRPATDGPRAERRLAELVDMMWQTDELRIVRPEPTDEARTAMHTLRFLADQVVPDLLAELDRTLAGIGVRASGDGPAPALRRLGRRRPRRQPQRDAGGHPRGHRHAARRRHRRARREARPHAPRAVVLDPLRRGHRRDAREPRARRAGTAGHLRRGPSPERRGALPAQAELRPRAPAADPGPPHPRHRARARPRLRELRRAARGPRAHP